MANKKQINNCKNNNRMKCTFLTCERGNVIYLHFLGVFEVVPHDKRDETDEKMCETKRNSVSVKGHFLYV